MNLRLSALCAKALDTMSDPLDPVYAPPAITDAPPAMKSARPAIAGADPHAAKPHPGRKLVWTLVPIAFYLIAYQMNIPTFKPTWPLGTRYPDFHALTAVGLFPWYLAAVVIRIVIIVLRLDRKSSIPDIDLYRATNFIGFVIALPYCVGIVFSWTSAGNLAVVLLRIPSFWTADSNISSPMVAFISLAGWTVFFKIFLNYAIPRSLLAKNHRLLAVVFLLPLLHSLIVNEFNVKYMDGADTIRMVVTCFQCLVLVAFIFLNPRFMSRDSQVQRATA